MKLPETNQLSYQYRVYGENMNHENHLRVEKNEGSSNRSFGLLFTSLFLVISLLPLFSGARVRYWTLAVTASLLLISILRPSFLTYPNRVWTIFGSLLHKIINPLVLLVIFFLVITPYSFIMRIFRKDQMCLALEPDADSYWQKRSENAQNMKHQF